MSEARLGPTDGPISCSRLRQRHGVWELSSLPTPKTVMASKELLRDIERFAFKYAKDSANVPEFMNELRLIIERSITEATEYMIHGPAAGGKQ